jgi:hypothetical protein
MLFAFLLHAIFGSLEFIGVWSKTIQTLTMVFAFIFLGLFITHAVIGMILGYRSIDNIDKTKTPYFRENKTFWIRWFSGVALTFIAIGHVIIFLGIMFNWWAMPNVMTLMLIVDIFLGLSLLFHLFSSMKSFLIDWGIDTNKIASLAIAVCVVLLCAYLITSFVIFYVGH